jgi:hypothetical protein
VSSQVNGEDGPAGRRPSATAAAISALPGLAEALVARHVDDGAGRCSECVRADRGREPWPCRIRIYADAALCLRPAGPA